MALTPWRQVVDLTDLGCLLRPAPTLDYRWCGTHFRRCPLPLAKVLHRVPRRLRGKRLACLQEFD